MRRVIKATQHSKYWVCRRKLVEQESLIEKVWRSFTYCAASIPCSAELEPHLRQAGNATNAGGLDV